MYKYEGWILVAPFVISSTVAIIISIKEKGFLNFISKAISFFIGVIVTLMAIYGVFILIK